MRGHIRTSTVVLIAVIAMLVGALGVTIHSRSVPVFIDTAHAASVESGPLVSFAPVVKRAMPAVVNISSSKVVKEQGMPSNGMFDDPFFRQFFGGRMPQQQQPRSQRATSLGSGVVVSPDGYILTNNHVVEGATDVRVTLSNKRQLQAKVVGADPQTDIAVLKVEGSGYPAITIGDSSKVQVGDYALAVGDPFGVGQTVTMGIVSAMNRGNLGIEDYEDFIQTDAPINPGNSGGALVNERGELIGINTAIIAHGSEGNQGIGFAVPVNLARNVMDQILKNGKVTRARLGILPQDVTPTIARQFGVKDSQGALVGEVEANSPAQKAGLKTGDIILEVNSNAVYDANQLRNVISSMQPDSNVNLKIWRDGAQRTLPVTLGELTAEAGRTRGGSARGDDNSTDGAIEG